MKGWLDNFGKADNANDSNVSLPEGFVGLGYNIKGRNYSPAWGGQFEQGGTIPIAQNGVSEYMKKKIQEKKDESIAAQYSLPEVVVSAPYLTKYNDPKKPTGFPQYEAKSDDIAEFYKSWVSSPEYERRMKDTGYYETPMYNSSRQSSITLPKGRSTIYLSPNEFLEDVRRERMGLLESTQDPGFIEYDPKYRSEYRWSGINLNPKDITTPERKQSVLAHEIAHAIDTTTPYESELISGTMFPTDAFNKQFYSQYSETHPVTGEPILSSEGWKKREKAAYVKNDPQEFKSDLNALRYLMFDKGIYDIRKGKQFTKKDLEKAKEKLKGNESLQRSLDAAGESGFIKLMNIIAKGDEEVAPIAMNGASMPGAVGFTYARTAGAAPSNGPYAKKTKASAQNGQEMRFYQNGLDWKPKSMQDGGIQRISTSDPRYPELYKNRQVGAFYDGAYSLPDLPEVVVTGKDERLKEAMYEGSNKFAMNALGLMSAPQVVTMEALTGKQQTPSEAWGFQNTGGWLDSPISFGKNVSNLAMDAILDPVNLLGVGLAHDITRTTLKGVGKRTVPNIRPVGNIRSSIDDIRRGSDLRGTGFEENPFYHKQLFEDRKKSVIERLNTDKGRQRLQDFIDDNYKKNPKSFGTENQNLLQWFKSGFKDYTKITPDKVVDDLKKMEFVPSSYAGFNKDNAFLWFHKGINNPSVMNIGEAITPYDALHTFEHELAHFFQRNRPSTVDNILSKLKLKEIEDPIKLNVFRSEAPLTETGYSTTKLSPHYTTLESPKNYFTSGSRGQEKMPFAAELRENLLQRGIIKDYYDDITPDLLRKHKDIYDKTGGAKRIQRLYQIMEDSPENLDILSQALNKMPQVALPIAGGAAATISALQNQQPVLKQKNGGITKDNQGYWNPDNWGKPVEIDSNNITMEGVYEPLLGISDTGDTKLMQPGKNYKFKGKKVTEFPVAQNGKFINQYTINKGDTLSAISKKTGYSVEQLAKANNIEDPDKIYAGQKLTIPYKFDKPLKIKDIPQEHHKNFVIDDYSKAFNYLVQGDKVYYTKKGSDNWVDISDNQKAKANLYNHLQSKYKMKGYSDYEKSIGKSIADSVYNYDKSYDHRYNTKPKNYVEVTPQKPKSLELKGITSNSFNDSFRQPKSQPVINDPFGRLSRMKPGVMKKEEPKGWLDYVSDIYDDVAETVSDASDKASEYLDLGVNWLERQYNKNSDAREESSFIKEPIITNSEYNINRPIITGDTLKINEDQYYLPEVMDLNEFTFKSRNRNEITPIETEAASITAFNPFQDYETVKKSNYPKNANFIGIDDSGNFKSGTIDQFSPSDKLSRVFKNNVESFATDDKGKMKFVRWSDNTMVDGKRVGNKDNPSSYVPLVNVIDDSGKKTVGTLNLLTKSPDDSGTFGQITGGRLVLKQGDKQILVSGSINDVKNQFDKLAKNGPVEVFTLDNGSYSRGLRTYDQKITEDQLRKYDLQNVSGGHFLYSTGEKPRNKYPESRYQTPNVRTESDESYLKGHPLKNELQGIVLHQTAYKEKDLSQVHNQFMTPNKNSAHVLIGYDGERRVYADPEQVTFHGGQSSFKGRPNVNDFMLGIEFQGVAGKDKLTDAQIESAIEYLIPIIRKYNIPIEHITSHGAVAPGRKHDISDDDLEKIYKIIRDRLYTKKRNGGNVRINQLDAYPMKKLNQLLNFTNNPDKDNWLDKYN